LKVWPHLEQRSEAWFRARAGRPTASQFDRIITATGKDSSQWNDFACELIAQCIRPDELPDFMGNRHTDRGVEQEPEARETFAKVMGLELVEVGFVTREDEVAGCSPDSLIRKSFLEWLAGLELKCPMAKKHAAYMDAGVLPDEYRQQVHGSMAVTGLNEWYFMSYCRGMKPFILPVQRDAYTEKVSDALDRFLEFYAAKREKLIPQLVLTEKEAA